MLPLWKGGSFDQYSPHGAKSRWCPDSEAVQDKIRKPRPGAGSIIAAQVPIAQRKRAQRLELDRARVVYRAATRSTDSRTMRACLAPPQVLLVNSAPYLVFVDGDEWDQAACLGVMNSLPFDWQVRRYVEASLEFFKLESMIVPDLTAEQYAVIAKMAARLSAVDERFDQFAQAVGVEVGPLDDAERQRLRVEIDARVAQAWDLTTDDLRLMFTDFTEKAVPPEYREALRDRLEDLIL